MLRSLRRMGYHVSAADQDTFYVVWRHLGPMLGIEAEWFGGTDAMPFAIAEYGAIKAA